MMIEYDSEVDALYVSFRLVRDGEVIRTQSLDANRNIDFGAEGEVLGVEILNVRDGFSLEGLPRAEEIRGALMQLRVAAPA